MRNKILLRDAKVFRSRHKLILGGKKRETGKSLMFFQYEINLISLCRHAEPLDTGLIIERMEFYVILRMSDYKPVKIECHSRLLRLLQQSRGGGGGGEEREIQSRVVAEVEYRCHIRDVTRFGSSRNE